MFFIRSVQKAVCEADLFLNNSEITVPAHAKMVPLKGKNAYASSILSGKEKAYASSILPGKEKAYASSILPGKEKVYASSILPGKEKSTPLVSPPERRCPPHPGALAGRHQASVSS